MTTIRCAHCGQTYDLTPEQVPQYAGRTITCTTCHQPFTVAIPGASPSIPPPSAPPPPPPPPSIPAGYATAYPQRRTYVPPAPAAPQKGNPLAVISLVLGIIGFVIPLIPGLIAVVLGILGIRKTRDPQVGGKGLAIAGLSVGAASIVLSGCLISILLPALNRAREMANRVHCAQNMKQIGLALLQYGSNNGGQYPPDLATLLKSTPLAPSHFVCPSSDDVPPGGATSAQQAADLDAGGHLSFVYVPGLTTSSSANAVLLYEPLTNHNNDGINVLFGDGHVEFLPRPRAEPLIAAVEAGRIGSAAGPG